MCEIFSIIFGAVAGAIKIAAGAVAATAIKVGSVVAAGAVKVGSAVAGVAKAAGGAWAGLSTAGKIGVAVSGLGAIGGAVTSIVSSNSNRAVRANPNELVERSNSQVSEADIRQDTANSLADNTQKKRRLDSLRIPLSNAYNTEGTGLNIGDSQLLGIGLNI